MALTHVSKSDPEWQAKRAARTAAANPEGFPAKRKAGLSYPSKRTGAVKAFTKGK